MPPVKLQQNLGVIIDLTLESDEEGEGGKAKSTFDTTPVKSIATSSPSSLEDMILKLRTGGREEKIASGTEKDETPLPRFKKEESTKPLSGEPNVSLFL